MTIAIASYERKDALVRLLQELQDLSDRSPAAWEAVDLVVVLDGSTDGSREAVADMDLTLPVQVIWQENAGLSAARNAGLRAATGEIIWLLDDDLIPLPGSIECHRKMHESPDDMVLLGPCHIPHDMEHNEASRAFWVRMNETRAADERVERFDLIAAANSSHPTLFLRSIGGFDERFVGYGLEDFELGLRLIESGIMVKFDLAAACWHYSVLTDRIERQRRREMGRNTVRFVDIHPDVAGHYFPAEYPSKSMRLLDRSKLRSPRLLKLASESAAIGATIAGRLLGRHDYVLRMLSLDASYAAGIADMDRSLLPRALGRPGRPAEVG